MTAERSTEGAERMIEGWRLDDAARRIVEWFHATSHEPGPFIVEVAHVRGFLDVALHGTAAQDGERPAGEERRGGKDRRMEDTQPKLPRIGSRSGKDRRKSEVSAGEERRTVQRRQGERREPDSKLTKHIEKYGAMGDGFIAASTRVGTDRRIATEDRRRPAEETVERERPTVADLLTMWAEADETRGANPDRVISHNTDWLAARERLIREACAPSERQQGESGATRKWACFHCSTAAHRPQGSPVVHDAGQACPVTGKVWPNRAALAPEEKGKMNDIRYAYKNDPMVQRFVDTIRALLRECEMTPSEVRASAMLACELHEAETVRPVFIQHGFQPTPKEKGR